MTAYPKPPRETNDSGEERRVGFELEFAGLQMAEVADILAETLEGDVTPGTHAECEVQVPGLGTFVVELDWQFAKETARERMAEQSNDDDTEVPDDRMMQWLTKAASQVVPVEIVCPPITVGDLHRLEAPVEKLRAAGALGTEESMIYAFGVHINPEIPDLKASTVIAYLKAYCVCQKWLLKAHDVDPVRRITPYIDLYPKEYLLKVLAYSGNEPMDQVIDDYLELNPTRNRALDMTPLFKHIDEARITSRLQDPRINSRPTFHYRMPNCAIEQPGWSLLGSWQVWNVIEQLAADEQQLGALAGQCLSHHEKLITFEEQPWHQKLDEMLEDLESA